MAFDEILAARIRDTLARKKNIKEKKMFGGVGFLLNGNMLVGVWKDSLIVRLGPDEGDEALLEAARQASSTSRARPMKGLGAGRASEGVEDDAPVEGVDTAGGEVRGEVAEEVTAKG